MRDKNDLEIAIDIKDLDGKRVIWYKESYNSHRKIAHRDTMPCFDKIHNKFNKPDLKFIDTRRKATHYYFLQRSSKKGIPLYLEVIVNYNTNPAHILSAHLTTNTRGATLIY